jgi:hypothetical protein
MIRSFSKLPLVILAVALLPVTYLQAQPDQTRHHGPPGAETRVAHLTRALDLSDEQSARLLEVFQAVDEERQALRQQAMLQMKPQICELQLATKAEISQILDDEQMAKLEDIKAVKKPGRERDGRRGFHDLDCSDS